MTEEVTTLDTPPVTAKAERVGKVKRTTTGDAGAITGDESKKVWVTIAQGHGPAGKIPAFIGLNGVGAYVPRGVKVALPRGYVGILENAVADEYDDKGNRVGSVPRYNFQVHGPVLEGEGA